MAPLRCGTEESDLRRARGKLARVLFEGGTGGAPAAAASRRGGSPGFSSFTVQSIELLPFRVHHIPEGIPTLLFACSACHRSQPQRSGGLCKRRLPRDAHPQVPHAACLAGSFQFLIRGRR
jgi:hypothetical protein